MSEQLKLEEIISWVKQGDQAAFRQLVETHQQYAFSLAFRILCDEEESKDAVQESFIKIWQKINSYNSNQKFSTWMYKIVTNTSIDRLRVIKRNGKIKIDEARSILEKVGCNLETMQENKEIGQIIGVLAEGLPQKQKLVFVLRDIQGLNSEEVAEIIGISSEIIKSNLYHARKSIREKLSKIIAFERRVK